MTPITINVDDFREAYDFLIAHGFSDPRGDKVTETSSSIATMLFSPTGIPVTVSEHIKALRYQDQIGDIKDDPRSQKQLKVMMDVVAAAFRNNMASYIKLVQMDVLKEFNFPGFFLCLFPSCCLSPPCCLFLPSDALFSCSCCAQD